MKGRMWSWGPATIGLLLLVGLTVPLWSQGSDGTFRVGVIDIGKVFQEWDEAKAYEQQLEKQRDEQAAEVKALEDKIRNLEEEIKALEVGSPLREQKERQMVRLMAEHEWAIKYWNARAEWEFERRTALFYNQLRDEIDLAAQDLGLNLVLKMESSRLENIDEGIKTSPEIRRRIVLYHGEGLDITQRVIERVNSD